MTKHQTSKTVRKVKNSSARHSPILGNKKRIWIISGIIGFALTLIFFIAHSTTGPGSEEPRKVVAETSKGQIVIEIYPKLMPKTVKNFEKLVNSNFYNGLSFHRVEDWVIQGGDPKGDGTGGPGWTIPFETSPELKNVRGAVAMARDQDPNSAGSQFYILKTDAPFLDGKYAVFGKVISGMETVEQIQVGDKMESVKE